MKIFQKNPVFALTLLLVPLMYLVSGCNSKSDSSVVDTSSSTTYNVTTAGTIYIYDTDTTLSGVTVRVIHGSLETSATTSSDGKYSIGFNVDTGMVVTIIASLTNYLPDTEKVYVAKGSVNNVASIYLKKVSSGSKISGNAASIYQYSQSSSSLGVRGSGALETGAIVFQVIDSSGVPLDITHTALVKFSFGGHPDGGEYLTPQYVYTDSSGQAAVYLTSGTVSGVVQVIAEISQLNKTITSLPVSYTINGGLPESSHFSIATQYLNFAGYDIAGLTNSVTAYVGDKYGNPVRSGTSVYFTSTGGIIPGSAQTSQSGTASVNLLSAAPRPTDATYGAGFATVTAATIDESQQTIKSTHLVLFSGTPTVSISPTTFDIPNGGSQTFTYYVKDENGNPLAPNTSINIIVDGENVKTAGETEINLPDTQSKAYTQFTFQLYDSVDTLETLSKVSIKIKVSGTNGSTQTAIYGTSK
jgi:hypothetical protein